ncbi:MAG TPA: glutathione peroxidase [Mobilitalea sp.]|nr:glutathione peroxidase [Mobilitalea sp.]
MSIFDLNVKDRNGKEVSLAEYKGKLILIINSATQCGFTPQYAPLQDLYEKYEEKGFVILDFPSNQFGGQAPGSNEEIHAFCDMNYGVKFPSFSKIDVNGDKADPLFKYLKSEKGFSGFNMKHPLATVISGKLADSDPDYASKSDIKWNFTKFLIDRNGVVVERFEPTEEFEVIEKRINDLL